MDISWKTLKNFNQTLILSSQNQLKWENWSVWSIITWFMWINMQKTLLHDEYRAPRNLICLKRFWTKSYENSQNPCVRTNNLWQKIFSKLFIEKTFQRHLNDFNWNKQCNSINHWNVFAAFIHFFQLSCNIFLILDMENVCT